jgi:RNA polymerase sigma factor (sigma-70 family)
VAAGASRSVGTVAPGGVAQRAVTPDQVGGAPRPQPRAAGSGRSGATVATVSRPVRPPDDDSAASEALLRRIRAGDPRALDELYDRYSGPAFGLARRILGDDGLAEDVLQEVFLAVWRRPAAFDAGRATVSSWLMAMVHHKAVDAVRREESQRRRRGLAEEELSLSAPTSTRDVEEQAWDRLVSERVRAALRDLPDTQREALTLAYYGGYTQREVADLTGAPLGTVKTRMLAGMRRLRRTLRQPTGDVHGIDPGEEGER